MEEDAFFRKFILNIILPKDEKTEVEMAEEILAEKKEMESK